MKQQPIFLVSVIFSSNWHSKGIKLLKGSLILFPFPTKDTPCLTLICKANVSLDWICQVRLAYNFCALQRAVWHHFTYVPAMAMDGGINLQGVGRTAQELHQQKKAWFERKVQKFTFLVLERLNFYMGLSLSSKMIPGDFNSKAVLKKTFALKGLVATLYLLTCYSITTAHTAMFKLGGIFW